jgi:hypothetical protein
MLPSSIRGKLMCWSSMLVHLVLEADRFLADLDERAPDLDNVAGRI